MKTTEPSLQPLFARLVANGKENSFIARLVNVFGWIKDKIPNCEFDAYKYI